MIRVFVGSSARFAQCEAAVERSIRENTHEQVQITFMRPDRLGIPESGCTGFTNLRWAVPELAGFEGFAIYLDVDMFLLADIAELWAYRQPGKWVALEDGSTEVAVIACSREWNLPELSRLHLHWKGELERRVPVTPAIPLEWNSEDRLVPGAKLLHFTDLKTQPWVTDHPDQQATQIWSHYARDPNGR